MELYKFDKQSLKFNKYNINKYIRNIIIINIIFILLIFLSIRNYYKTNKNIIYSEEYIPVKLSVDNFSIVKLKAMLECLNIKHSDIVLAQAILETGNFNSKIFKENNNLFGMKLSKTRPTTALEINNNHAYYKSWQESVIDYAFWQTTFCRKLNREEYLNYLNSVYAEDKDYKNKLLKLIDNGKR